MKMVTTRQINQKRDDTSKPLGFKTTKEIKVEYTDKEPFKAGTGPTISTHNIEEFQDKIKIIPIEISNQKVDEQVIEIVNKAKKRGRPKKEKE